MSLNITIQSAMMVSSTILGMVNVRYYFDQSDYFERLFMGFLGNLKNVLYKMDFFYTAELLRYREEPEYRTLFGGFLSLSIILLLLVTFYNKVIDTFDKVIISSSVSAINANDPILYTVSTMSGKPFMLGVQIWHHDLNANPRYFDVALTNVFYDTGEPNENKSVSIPLQPCTKEHWSDYPKIQQNYQRMSIKFWLCLPKNTEFEIYGKYASETSKTLEVSVSRCTNSTDYTYPCASDADIDQLFQDQQNFFYTAYFINPLINSDNQQYLSHYLEDSNYVIFSATAGEECQLWMEDFTITTDQSIVPFVADNVDTGGIVTKNCIKNRYTINPADPAPLYSTFMIFKSPISKSIGRSFQKIDEILSYIGGLFGTIAICLFLVNIYNSYSFEILMGGYLFKPDDDNMKKELKKYNFFYFLVHLVYALVSAFGRCCNWKTAKLYHECREEMTKQLDILYLYKRVVLLERGLSTLLSERQLSALHLLDKPTLAEAKKTRRKYKFNHDSFLYRALAKNRDICESQEVINERKVGDSVDKVDEMHPEPHNVTNDEINGHIASKSLILSINQSSGSRLKRPEFLNEHEESSDSGEESEDRDETEEMLRELASLRAEAGRTLVSRSIWNRLSEEVQSVANSALEVYDESRVELKNDNNMVEPLGKEDSPEQARQLQRKPKMRRFNKQLPALTVPEGVKVMSRWEEDELDSTDPKKQQSFDQFIEMREFDSPYKKNK